MSEDTAQLASDAAGTLSDPLGIVVTGDGGSHYDLDHGVTVICDSARGLLARLAVRAEAKKSKRQRIACPAGCGRMATVYVRKARQ